ncbi:MAG: S-layer homology domain-containing protein [Cyanobacteriota bacterium]|nr:S-layer homology domain-containing protein [Cyanobacteriota bacterium]
MRRFLHIAGLAIAIASLSGCANSSLEEAFKPDPQLQDNQPFGQSKPETPEPTFVKLPDNFPSKIPVYPDAKLRDVTASEKDNEVDVITHWKTNDPINLVQNYYQQQFKEKDWKVVEEPNAEGEGSFVVRQEDLQVTLSLKPNSTSSGETDLEIRYIQDRDAIAKNNNNSDTDQSVATIPLPPPPPPVASEEKLTQKPTPTDSPTPTPTDSPEIKTSLTPKPSPNVAETSPKLDGVPKELQPYIRDVSKLGILQATPNSQSNSSNNSTIANPNTTITRGEFARWLVNANNNFYANSSAKQIRLGVSSSEPAFTDVPTTHPYFSEIQGLAEAGLIPSSLSGESTIVSFRPDAPLTREDMVLWKVPLDTRQTLPKATVDAVQERWGFQDTAKINTNSLRAVLADFDNGDNANIRRVFGFTTLFQPKKSVTRAEAASTLWYFGFQGDGISAQELLKTRKQSQDNDDSSN